MEVAKKGERVEKERVATQALIRVRLMAQNLLEDLVEYDAGSN